MHKYAEILVLLLCLGGSMFVLDNQIYQALFSYVDILEANDAVATSNSSSGGNLRKPPPLSSLTDTPDESSFLSPAGTSLLEPIDKKISMSSLGFSNITTFEEETMQQRGEEKPQDINNENLNTFMKDNNATHTMQSASSGSKQTLVWNMDAHEAIRTGAQLDTKGKIFLVEDEKGYVNSNGKLVVDVNETYLFWDDGQEKLCNLLQNMTLSRPLDKIDGTPIPSTVLNVTMDCIDHNQNKQGFGQGNWITAVYAARMAAYLAGVDFNFQCLDGQDSKMSLLLPWFDKYQEAQPTNRKLWPHGGIRPTEKEACTPKYPFLRIDKMAFEIQDDLRKMAVTLVGTRDQVRQHPDVPIDATPLIPGVELDDVALHFRCGDVLGGFKRSDFGMIRFSEYKKWIPNNTESIGILTQPFDIRYNRLKDRKNAEKCRIVVNVLVDYLQDFAPNAKISIHNGVNETHPLAYARLVMANISITSLSSFGIFPIIGTFGDGYFQKGNRGVNPFATHIPKILPNIHEMRAEVRATGQMLGKSMENIVEWFVNDTTIP